MQNFSIVNAAVFSMHDLDSGRTPMWKIGHTKLGDHWIPVALPPPASNCELTRWQLKRPIFFRFPKVLPEACEPQRLHQPPNSVSEALPSLSDRTRTFWVRMEIIKSFQPFENLADRTFRGRSLGYQDEYEPEVDVAERGNAWRSGHDAIGL